MKLRNKKTGEIVEFGSMRQYWREEKDGGMAYLFQKQGDNVGIVYNSLAELNEEWEDYEPSEPLIKDEKVRKAVRAWAEACDVERIYLSVENEEGSTFCVYTFQSDCNFIQIATHDHDPIGGGRAYTIAELCGEEEE